MALEIPGARARRRDDADGVSGHFPAGFDFYGLWSVSLSGEACDLSECAAAPFLVAFQVSGDIRGACVVSFDREPASEDAASAWIELANTLAAKLVSSLADEGARDSRISPPEAVRLGDLRQRHLRSALLAGGTPGSVSRRYEVNGERPVVARMAFLPAIGNGGSA